MKNKIGVLVSLGALVILVGAGCANTNSPVVEEEKTVETTETQPVAENNPETGIKLEGEVELNTDSVKEFTMTAYYDAEGKWFSLKEMKVKKGDTVRVKVTNTAGMHDFVIDELKVAKDLPLNEEVVIEFVADKAGEFVYYCSIPGHREGGQWGTLKVTE